MGRVRIPGAQSHRDLVLIKPVSVEGHSLLGTVMRARARRAAAKFKSYPGAIKTPVRFYQTALVFCNRPIINIYPEICFTHHNIGV